MRVVAHCSAILHVDNYVNSLSSLLPTFFPGLVEFDLADN